MEKLKNLQQQYGLKSSSISSSSEPSNNVSNTKPAPVSSGTLVNLELAVLSSTTSVAKPPTDTSVQDLKERLARIKQSISTQNETK